MIFLASPYVTAGEYMSWSMTAFSKLAVASLSTSVSVASALGGEVWSSEEGDAGRGVIEGVNFAK